MPHGTIRSNAARSGSQLSANPCRVTPRATRMPIAATLRSGPRSSARTQTPLRPSTRVVGQAQLGADVDEQLLGAPHVRDHVDRVGQQHDRVADELPRPVPGDLAAAVHVDDRRAVERALPRLGALARGVDARVLQQQHGVRAGRPRPPPSCRRAARPRRPDTRRCRRGRPRAARRCGHRSGVAARSRAPSVCARHVPGIGAPTWLAACERFTNMSRCDTCAARRTSRTATSCRAVALAAAGPRARGLAARGRRPLGGLAAGKPPRSRRTTTPRSCRRAPRPPWCSTDKRFAGHEAVPASSSTAATAG